MIALDAGLIALAVNRFAPEHARAARVVEDLANGESPWALPWPAVDEFLRRVTHPHAVVRPLAPADAWGVIEALAAAPALQFLGPTPRHAEAMRELLAAAPPGAGLPPGIEIAAVLREHGVRELLSTDAGMRRFGFLEVRNPLVDPAGTQRERPARRYRRLRVARPRR